MATHHLLKTSPSLFGKITIGETFDPHVRWMKINDEIEGQVFIEKEGAPGPIAASPYLYAFVILAWQFSDKKGLILGLGAGAGVTLLLALFPNLFLTVVEIDREIIRLAREYFPLITHHETQGRLKIVESAAGNYVDQCQEKFAFTVLDMFSGDEGNSSNLALISKIAKISRYFMANIITAQSMHTDLERAAHVQQEDFVMWLSATETARSTEKINWILTNLDSISPEIQYYSLFDLSLQTQANVITANRYFKYILSQIEASCFYR